MLRFQSGIFFSLESGTMTRFHRNLISDKHSLCLQRSDAVSIYDGIQAYVKS